MTVKALEHLFSPFRRNGNMWRRFILLLALVSNMLALAVAATWVVGAAAQDKPAAGVGAADTSTRAPAAADSSKFTPSGWDLSFSPLHLHFQPERRPRAGVRDRR